MIDLSIKDVDRVQGLLSVQASLVQKITDLEIVNAALRRTVAEVQKPEERVAHIPPKLSAQEIAEVKEAVAKLDSDSGYAHKVLEQKAGEKK